MRQLRHRGQRLQQHSSHQLRDAGQHRRQPAHVDDDCLQLDPRPVLPELRVLGLLGGERVWQRVQYHDQRQCDHQQCPGGECRRRVYSGRDRNLGIESWVLDHAELQPDPRLLGQSSGLLKPWRLCLEQQHALHLGHGGSQFPSPGWDCRRRLLRERNREPHARGSGYGYRVVAHQYANLRADFG